MVNTCYTLNVRLSQAFVGINDLPGQQGLFGKHPTKADSQPLVILQCQRRILQIKPSGLCENMTSLVICSPPLSVDALFITPQSFEGHHDDCR